MKGDIYYLKRKSDGEIVARFEQTEEYMSGHCYLDDLYFARVFCKSDSCTHWNFNGETYIEHLDSTISGTDSYYHICGSYCLADHIRTMCFLWKLAVDILSEGEDEEHKEYVTNEYFDTDEIKQLVTLMLEGYVIEKETK